MSVRVARACAIMFTAVSVVLLSGNAAMASTTPEGWPTGPTLSPLQIIGIFVGIPAALFAGILLVAGFAVSKSVNYVPPTPPAGEAIEPGSAESAASLEAH